MINSRGFRALIVDDESDNRFLLSRALQNEGIRADTAEDGIIAENMLKARRYDVLISDLRMPRKHGHQLIVETLSLPRPPIVFAVTAIGQPKLVRDLVARGVTDVIPKPVAHELFAARVRALLERRAIEGNQAEVKLSSEKVSAEIGQVADGLRAQLEHVTESFQATIGQLNRQRDDLEAGFLGSLRVLTNIFDSGDSLKQSHAGRVERISVEMARQLGLDKVQTRNIQFASLLHEIGQFGMPDHIRGSAMRVLSDEDRRIAQAYPAIGATLLSEIRGGEPIAVLVEAHAENFDGSGFPKGLRGEAIPLGARIIRCADGCDTHLMYNKHATPMDEIVRHLHEQVGHAYDPELMALTSACVCEVHSEPAADDVLELSADGLRRGMILHDNVYDPDGRFLARQGATLTDAMLERLQRLIGNRPIRVLKEMVKVEETDG